MTKKEQLKVAFRKILFEFIDEVTDEGKLKYYDDSVRDTAEVLLKEVSIRTDLR